MTQKQRKKTAFYQLSINDVARHIRSSENMALVQSQDPTNPPMTAFGAAAVLAIVFCKNQGEIVHDIVAA